MPFYINLPGMASRTLVESQGLPNFSELIFPENYFVKFMKMLYCLQKSSEDDISRLIYTVKSFDFLSFSACSRVGEETE